MSRMIKRCLIGVIMVLFMAGCVRPAYDDSFIPPAGTFVTPSPQTGWQVPTHNPVLPVYTPTPNPPRQLPATRTETIEYTVKSGDTLAAIAKYHTLPLSVVAETNNIEDPNLLEVGQVLVLPPPELQETGSAFKILPDSEIIRSPTAIGFSVEDFTQATGGFLNTYREEVGDVELTGAQIIERVSREFSVHPHVLLTWLEYQGNWISSSNPDETQQKFPAGYQNPYYEGLYYQMAWTANNLNMGYYLWKSNAVSAWILTDDAVIPPDPTINPGTAAVQHLASLIMDQPAWRSAVSENGFSEVFTRYFGQAFDYSIDPLIPANLTQPVMQLPFEENSVWSFTGGPHGAWGTGSAWGAIDFAPPGDALGCVQSDAWVTAAAGGVVTRSDNGVVAIDLDGDGYEETGWVLLNLHIETRDRIPAGSVVAAGDRIGHPSCEGGISNGTHVHLARKYNGEWIPADQDIPFVLDGWVSQGTGVEYNGYLVKNGQIVEAWDRRTEINQIQR